MTDIGEGRLNDVETSGLLAATTDEGHRVATIDVTSGHAAVIWMHRATDNGVLTPEVAAKGVVAVRCTVGTRGGVAARSTALGATIEHHDALVAESWTAARGGGRGRRTAMLASGGQQGPHEVWNARLATRV